MKFWTFLQTVRHLSFSVKSKQRGGMTSKMGRAEVQIISSSPTVCIFQEMGYWLKDQMPETTFHSSFRWTLDTKATLITLEHLRYGASHPVFLFHLTPTKPFYLETVDAHLCVEDSYLGSILWSSSTMHFHWRVLGPFKNEELIYSYS